MAGGVDVHITDRAIITALNTPGGAVFDWRDDTAEKVGLRAIALSPINNPLDATHRGGLVGTYKASWGWDRVGSNGHEVRATIYNAAAHADIVEFGRNSSNGPEVFGWTQHVPPGEVDVHLHGTRGRLGRHVLLNAVNGVMPEATGGTFVPLQYAP